MLIVRGAPLALLLLVAMLPARASWVSPFISELHYDNAGSDVAERVAVTGPSGLDLDGWQIVLYNGANGQAYQVHDLSGVLADTPEGWAESSLPVPGIQNGPDAVALVSPLSAVIDFVAYEAQLTAADGAAAGMAARLLPVAEASDSPVGGSLQRAGSADDWIWSVADATPGVLNPGLLFAARAAVPASGGGLLLLAGLAGWGLSRLRGHGTPLGVRRGSGFDPVEA